MRVRGRSKNGGDGGDVAVPVQSPEVPVSAPGESDGVGVWSGTAGVALPPLSHSLTSDMAHNVRFEISEPRGYFFPQVEEYVATASSAIGHLEQAVHARDLLIHTLQVDLDHQTYDVIHLRTQIEVFKVQGSPLVNADGSYVTESQQKAADDANRRADTLQLTLSETQDTLDTAEAALRRTADQALHAEREAVDLRALAAQVNANLTAALDAVTGRDEALTLAYQEITDLRLALTVARTPTAGAVATIPEPAYAPPSVSVFTPPPAPDFTPAPAPVMDVEYTAGDLDASDGMTHLPTMDSTATVAVAVAPHESELAPGAVLPVGVEGPSATFTYHPARPGDPLHSGQIPAQHWAPELT